MKKIAILVIAATNQPVYEFYIRNYWTDLIKYLSADRSHIDVFLLFEKKFGIKDFPRLRDNIIHDADTHLAELCNPRFHTPGIPGVLAKTMLAFEQLQDEYDVFFRTNLSSMLKLSKFDDYVQGREFIRYSGSFIWKDRLRDDMVLHNRIGPNKSVTSLSELESYKGNTFISGSGYFLSRQEVASLVKRKKEIRYDIVDDVSIGLMFEEHEQLKGFTTTIRPESANTEKLKLFSSSAACHFRLQHFPIGVAQQFWDSIKDSACWK